jgi:hypothetical protein
MCEQLIYTRIDSAGAQQGRAEKKRQQSYHYWEQHRDTRTHPHI